MNHNNKFYILIKTIINMKEEILKKIGLSEHETKIYITLLRIGESTATKIAKETNIDRATTYRFLSSLIERGLVSYIIKNNIKYFKSVHPKKIDEDLKNLREDYKNILPELESILKIGTEETNVELFKGEEGLKAIMKDILRERKDYTFIGEIQKFFETMPIYIEQWLKQVEELKIKGRLICTEGTSFKVAKTETYKLISKDFISKISTWTYGNKTALFIWSVPSYGVLIDNSEVTESNVNLFNFLWKIGKSVTNKTKD